MTTSTFTWFGGSGFANDGTNWTPAGPPGPTDTAIVTSGTVFMPTGAQLNNNIIEIGSATLSFVGDSTLNYSNPTLDGSTTIVSTGTVATTTQLISAGTFVNQGTIDAKGLTGSSFTIDITANGTAPGYFTNYGEIDVGAGNSMTISIAGTAELFNVSAIQVSGGSLFINAATDAIAGGYAPVGGNALIMGGGTLETNVNYGTSVSGVAPYYIFADATAGNTLKIDNIGSFGGVIVGFGAGDTIDLGTSLAVGTLVYSGTSGVLELENSGTVLASLLVSGNFQTGTAALSGGSALGFTVGTVGGDTVLTTAVQNFVASNSSGVWQGSTTWAAIPGGVPGTADSAFIGLNAKSSFVVTTGSSAVQVGNLNLVDDRALLQITSSTTAGPSNINAFGGTLEVTSGNTLTTPGIRMFGATVEVDPTSVLDLTGHVITSLAAVNGTLAVQSGNTAAVRLFGGDLLVNGGILNAGTGQSGGNGGNILIGYDGGGTPGVVTVQNSGTNAGVVTDTYAILSSDPTSFGILTLTGNASWTDQIDPHDTTTRGYMLVGNNNEVGNTQAGAAPAPFTNAATLVVEGGAALTEQNYAYIGATKDSAGSATIETGGIWTIGTGGLGVGFDGLGSLSILSAGTVAVGSGGIGMGNSAVAASGTITVSDANSLLTTAGGMNVGKTGQGLLQVLNGGTVQVTGKGITAGASAGSSGTIIVSGTGSGLGALLNLGAGTGGITVGSAGQGTADVGSGGTISLNGTGGITLGQSSGVTGILDITGPNALVTLGTTAGGITVGSAGHGTLDIESGGTIQMHGTGGIGAGSSLGTGLIIVNGPNALLNEGTAGSGIFAGNGGQGTLDVEGGGTVTNNGTFTMAGAPAGSNGTITVNGTGALLNGTAAFIIGNSGTGTATVSNGGVVNAGTQIAVGQLNQSNGSLTIQSGGTVTGTGGANVGNTTGSNGQIAVLAGGTLALTGGINVGMAGQGTLSVSGTGAAVTAGGLNIGSSGNGVLSIGNGGLVASSGGVFVRSGTLQVGTGGTLIASGGTILSDINATGTGHAAATVSGGTWTSNQLIIGDTGTGSLDINSNGLVNAGTNFVDIGNQSGGSGAVSVEGGGTLEGSSLTIATTFTGTANGTLTVGTGGSVQVGSVTESQGGLITVTGGTLSASGSGNIDIGFGGSGALLTIGSLGVVGTSSGSMTIGNGTTSGASGTVTVNASGSLFVGGGLYVGSGTSGSFGTLAVNGGVVTDAGSLFLGNGSNTFGTLIVSGGTVATNGLTVGSGSALDMAGGILSSSGPLQINGALNGFGTLVAGLSNIGTVTASGGRLVVNGGIAGTGFDTINGGSTLEVGGGGGTLDSNQSVNFATSGSPAALQLDLLPSLTQGFGLSNWQPGDELIIANGVSVSSAVLTGSTLAVITSGGTYDFTNVTLAAGAPSSTFNIVGTNAVQLACFVTGTRIGTERGDVAVEELREGDRVAMALGGAAEPIVWIGHREVDCAHHPKPQLVWPVRIAAGAFGPGVPHRDLWLSPDHAVFFGGVLIPVKYLVNGSSIVQVATDEVTYWHVELPRHAVLLAEGLPAESYLDVGDRSNFANGGGAVALYPDFASRVWEAAGCAPLVVTGPEVEAARARVNARATAARRRVSAGRR